MLTLRPEPSPDTPIRGVHNPQRLRAVAAAELRGHLGDPDLDAVVATLRLACGVPIAVINIVTENLQTYPAEVGVGAPCTQVPDGLSFCAEVVDTGLALAVADAAAHPVYSRNPMVVDGVIGAYAGVPLVDDGVVLGSVSIFGGSARKFSADVLDILGLQTRLASSVLALRRSARTDVLTGLPNRDVLLARLRLSIARLDRHAGLACVLYFDLDGFKGINDEFGHAVGDAVLHEFARRRPRPSCCCTTPTRRCTERSNCAERDRCSPRAGSGVVAGLIRRVKSPRTRSTCRHPGDRPLEVAGRRSHEFGNGAPAPAVVQVTGPFRTRRRRRR